MSSPDRPSESPDSSETLPGQERDRVARIRAGDHQAYEAMFRTFYGPLCDFAARYVRSPSVAEELVQDVFFLLWRAREKWEVRGSIRTYLYGAVRNRALTYLTHADVEQRWRDRVERDQPHLPVASSEFADTALELADLAQAVQRVIDRLPERCRMVFTLSREHQLTYPEIARAMGISVRTVEVQIGRALKALRDELGARL